MAECHQERDPRHVERLESTLVQRRAMGTAFVQTYFRYLVADAWLSLGRANDARHSIEQAIADAESTGEKLWFAELIRMRARISLMIGDRDFTEIERDLKAAIADARSRGALAW